MAQVIRRNFRRDHRRDTPSLAVKIGDDVVHSRDWSLGGLAIYDMHRLSLLCAVDDIVVGTLGATDDATDYAFSAEVVRVEPGTNMLALKFADLSKECFAFLEGMLRRPRSPAAETSARR
ncbi:MAG: PilZ domain-containing protein [Alphaproteobacteria bacterium]